MAIERRGYNTYAIVCDRCGYEVEDFEEFDEAVAWKRDYGFHSTKVNGYWEDVCEECWDKQHGNCSAADDFAGIGR